MDRDLPFWRIDFFPKLPHGDHLYPGYLMAKDTDGRLSLPETDYQFTDIGRGRISLQGGRIFFGDEGGVAELPIRLEGEYDLVLRRFTDDLYGTMIYLVEAGQEILGGHYVGDLRTARWSTFFTCGEPPGQISGDVGRGEEALVGPRGFTVAFGVNGSVSVARLYSPELKAVGWWFGAEPLGRSWNDRVMPDDDVMTLRDVVDSLEPLTDFPSHNYGPVRVMSGNDLLGYVARVEEGQDCAILNLIPAPSPDAGDKLIVPPRFSMEHGATWEEMLTRFEEPDEDDGEAGNR